jgi:hypothetical protein
MTMLLGSIWMESAVMDNSYGRMFPDASSMFTKSRLKASESRRIWYFSVLVFLKNLFECIIPIRFLDFSNDVNSNHAVSYETDTALLALRWYATQWMLSTPYRLH